MASKNVYYVFWKGLKRRSRQVGNGLRTNTIQSSMRTFSIYNITGTRMNGLAQFMLGIEIHLVPRQRDTGFVVNALRIKS